MISRLGRVEVLAGNLLCSDQPTSPGPIAAKLELLSHLEEVVDAGCDKLVLGSGQAESR